ncbi:collagen alpha-1(iii) chain [Plakobranchus ocellatus]|uniref:Collagen alpha-1(Iii) chain n=1 Tax=Plakobranchus ocellatus TaxID=259542 RepID=A0AAV4AJT8_9GAST|nr:collagen alpha-1(iii) chain [Plakobranchus ocellatus]
MRGSIYILVLTLLALSTEDVSGASLHKNCTYQGQVYAHSESVDSDPCIPCTCLNGLVSCVLPDCHFHTYHCPSPMVMKVMPGDCCATCQNP